MDGAPGESRHTGRRAGRVGCVPVCAGWPLAVEAPGGRAAFALLWRGPPRRHVAAVYLSRYAGRLLSLRRGAAPILDAGRCGWPGHTGGRRRSPIAALAAATVAPNI